MRILTRRIFHRAGAKRRGHNAFTCVPGLGLRLFPRMAATALLSALLAMPVLADDEAEFQKGFKAFQAGEYAAAIGVWRPMADRGVEGAQYNIGYMYQEGLGLPQDFATAASWYKQAADQGHGGAQFNLGILYDLGRGVPQDHSQSAAWYRKAALQGESGAQNRLGIAYIRGEGVDTDLVAAHVWLSLAKVRLYQEKNRNGFDRNQKVLDSLEQLMSKANMEKAGELAGKCWESNYRDCP